MGLMTRRRPRRKNMTRTDIMERLERINERERPAIAPPSGLYPGMLMLRGYDATMKEHELCRVEKDYSVQPIATLPIRPLCAWLDGYEEALRR